MSPRPSHVTIKRVDSVHAAFIAAARGVGATIIDTHILGRGNPDAVIIFHGKAFLCEFKSPGGQLTPAEKRFALFCREPVWVVKNVDELLSLIGATEYCVGRAE